MAQVEARTKEKLTAALTGRDLTGSGKIRQDDIPSGDGGGVATYSGSTFQQTGGDIYSNRASGFGGGVYVGDDVAYIQTDNGTIGEGGFNMALQGAGVYNEGIFAVDGYRLLENGLGISGLDSAVHITAQIQPGSSIQLEENDYVRPDLSAAPIVVAVATEDYPLLTPSDANGFYKPVQNFEYWEVKLNDARTQVQLVPAEYEIHYDNLQGATNPNPASYDYYTQDIILEAPIWTGSDRQFLGWFDAPQEGNQVTVIPSGSSGERTLYARWSVTLIYHGNDAGGPPAGLVPEPQTIEQGQSVELSDVVPIREGYRFTEWNTQPDGSGTSYQPGTVIGPLSETVNLYAQWEMVLYTVTYDGNDEGGPAAERIPMPQIVMEGQLVTLSGVVPTRQGYQFMGWNTMPDGSGMSYEPGDSFGPVLGNADLYAQWEAEPVWSYRLTYEANDVGGPPACGIPKYQEVWAGQPVILSAAVPRRTCYWFVGWNKEPDGTGVTYQPGDDIGVIGQDLTVYALWRPAMHEIRYDGNDAGGPPACCVPCIQWGKDGQNMKLSDMIPKRRGYCFVGWNTRSDGLGTAFCSGQCLGPVFDSLYLYAQWAPCAIC